MKILIVEDDIHVADVLRRGLSESGYVVDIAHDGQEGEYLALNSEYDLIILDIMLPVKDGVEICKVLRLNRISAPILMLTAKETVEDRVRGLDSGADDYLVKPFAFSELLARVRAVLRRQVADRNPRLQVGDLILDYVTREVWRGKRPIKLTNKEYIILEYFMRHPGAVITRTMIEDYAWDYEFYGTSNLVDVYIRNLRRKIDVGGKPSLFQTVIGAGYRLTEP